jgi:hypothetical protein
MDPEHAEVPGKVNFKSLNGELREKADLGSKLLIPLTHAETCTLNIAIKRITFQQKTR